MAHKKLFATISHCFSTHPNPQLVLTCRYMHGFTQCVSIIGIVDVFWLLFFAFWAIILAFLAYYYQFATQKMTPQ